MARSFINDVVFRVSYIASSPSRLMPNLGKGIAGHLNLKEENEKLREVIENYKSLDLNLEYLTNENKKLRKVLNAENIINAKDIVLAKVLVDRNSPFLKSIIINKGTQSGIKKGMPVTQNNYLVGRIVDTNYLSSRVLLLTDLNSRIPVSLDADSSQAILTGSGTKNPKLEYLPEEYEFKEDVNVFASGKERIFIPGTPIGKTTEKGEVRLYVDPNQLSFVTVILTRNNKEQF
jgi:rod shape-determining protein MreC